jgi:hypothetical protein
MSRAARVLSEHPGTLLFLQGQLRQTFGEMQWRMQKAQPLARAHLLPLSKRLISWHRLRQRCLASSSRLQLSGRRSGRLVDSSLSINACEGMFSVILHHKNAHTLTLNQLGVIAGAQHKQPISAVCDHPQLVAQLVCTQLLPKASGGQGSDTAIWAQQVTLFDPHNWQKFDQEW